MDVTAARLAVDFVCRRSNQKFSKYVGVAKSRLKNGALTTGGIGNGSGNQRWLDVVAGSVYVPSRTFFSTQNLGLPAA